MGVPPCLSAELPATNTHCFLLQLLVCTAGAVSPCESCSLVLSAAKTLHLLLVGTYEEMGRSDIPFPRVTRDYDASFSKVLSLCC